jgi:hypothetical protein
MILCKNQGNLLEYVVSYYNRLSQAQHTQPTTPKNATNIVTMNPPGLRLPAAPILKVSAIAGNGAQSPKHGDVIFSHETDIFVILLTIIV